MTPSIYGARAPQAETRLSRILSADGGAPGRAREVLYRLADGLSADLIRDAQLLVSDLVTDAIHQLPAGAIIGLEVSVTDDRLHVEVVQHRRGRVRDPVPPGPGLQIVAELADRWGIRRGRVTTTWFELDR